MALFGNLKSKKYLYPTAIPPVEQASDPIPTSTQPTPTSTRIYPGVQISDPTPTTPISTWVEQSVYNPFDTYNPTPLGTGQQMFQYNTPYQYSNLYSTGPNSAYLLEVNKLVEEWLSYRLNQLMANFIEPFHEISRTLDEISSYISRWLRDLERDTSICTELKRLELKPFGNLEFELRTTYSPPDGVHVLNRLIYKEGYDNNSKPPPTPIKPKKTVLAELKELLKEKLEVNVKVERIGESISVHTQIIFDGEVIADDSDCD